MAVLFYHAGSTWMGGGFLGVEVFFVLSGFLITGLLVGEWRRTGGIRLPAFYLRRARRLLPALYLLLVAVVVFTAVALAGELARLRGDVFAALTYVTNWFLIANDQSYFEALGRPSLLQHLWSLAIEEQYYVVWPLALLALLRFTGGDRRRLFLAIIGTAAISTIWMAVLYEPFADPSRIYYGTDTRVASLLIGSALAVAWRPDATRRGTRAGTSLLVDGAAIAALAVLGVWSMTVDPYGDFLYRGGFALVSLVTAGLIVATTHPASRIGRAVLGNPLMRWLGLRSYAIYLWHWPIFMVTRPQLDVPIDGPLLFALRLGLTLVAADLSYRYVEDPIRHGALGRWWTDLRRSDGETRRALRHQGLAIGGVASLVVVLVGMQLIGAAPSAAVAGLPSGVTVQPGISPSATRSPTVDPVLTPSGASGSHWKLPVDLAIVGDSQANLLVLNAPASVADTFRITNGFTEGCGVLLGRMTSSRGFRRNMAECAYWPDHWREVIRDSGAPIGLVVLGAWDVFDLEVDGRDLEFGSEEWDAYFESQLAKGIDALREADVLVALLGIPCYRPIDAGGLIALPERGDDTRTRHVNELLRHAAAEDPAHVFYIEPPREFCTDEAIATDVYYRWDGVHYGGKGARLVFERITDQLLAIPRP